MSEFSELMEFQQHSSYFQFFLQGLSLAAYAGSLYFQDQILKASASSGLSATVALSALTLATTATICSKGASCLNKGTQVNAMLFAFSTVILVSTLMTIHGQATAGIMARLMFKSSKVIPTTIMEIVFLRRHLSSFSASASFKKLAGCGLLTLGCLIYFSETSMHRHSHRNSKNYMGADALSGMMLLLGASLLDSSLTILESKLLFGKASRCHVSVVEAAFGFSIYGLLMLFFACMIGVLQLELENMPLTAVDPVAFCICSSVAYALTFYFIASGGPAFSESFKVFRKIAVLVGFAFISSTAPSGRAAVALAMCCLGLYFVDPNSKSLPSVAKWSKNTLTMGLVSIQKRSLPFNNCNKFVIAAFMVVLLSMSFLLGSPFTASHTTISVTARIY